MKSKDQFIHFQRSLKQQKSSQIIANSKNNQSSQLMLRQKDTLCFQIKYNHITKFFRINKDLKSKQIIPIKPQQLIKNYYKIINPNQDQLDLRISNQVRDYWLVNVLRDVKTVQENGVLQISVKKAIIIIIISSMFNALIVIKVAQNVMDLEIVNAPLVEIILNYKMVNPGFFIQQNNCFPCDSSCLTCTGTSTNCTSCQPDLFLNVSQSTCLPSCPENGFYVSGQSCMPCDPTCATCSGPLQTQCNSCQSNLFQYDDDKMCKACPNSSIDPSIIAQKMQNCSQITQKCLLSSQTNKYELTAICNQCQSPQVLSNNNCVQTCSEVAQDYIFNQSLGYCQCIPSSPYQHNLPNGNILCNSFQLSGYYCDQNKICNPCQQSKCQICANQQICTACEQSYYMWQNNCINACESDLGLEVSQSNKECICKPNYIFYAQKQICILQLQINSIKLTKDLQYNIITVVFNRSPYPDELKTISLQIDPNKLIPNTDYRIVSQQQNDKNLIFQVSTNQNIKISQIVINYNSKQAIYKVQNTILTSEEANQHLQSQQSTMNSMNSLGQTLSPQEGTAQSIVNILKNFQIICLLSNFVQLLGPLIVFKDYLPQPLYVGALLGASFIFTEIPNSEELSANLINSNSNNQEQSSQQSLLEHLGFSENIYSNLPIPHLLLIVCVVISLLCLFARWIMKGKQYTMTIVNLLVNAMSSFHQGYITCSLFSIFYSLQYSSQRLVAVIQLSMHIIFLILICVIVIKKDIAYIKNNIPNFMLNLNIKSRGWKSYLIMSYLKKYICITIIYAIYYNPLACCIAISVNFVCFAMYLLYFRFFTSKICNIYKIFQELVISLTFILFAVSVKKQQQMMQKDIISNEEMISTIDFSLIVLFMIISCLALSFFIFIARTSVQIFMIVLKIRKYFQEKKKFKTPSQELDFLFTQKKQNLELPVIKIQIRSSYINKTSSNNNSVKNNLKNDSLKEEII
ncbi:transmembrane protein, putative (macronuclear) [Tetrahymena thermophila SB210]|uniref:Transmembrane protein, putative n=1 Tax=Tetrahymena thermophila (strain SB210) TaxID=312017 RepID=Q234N0_TETTS|nr:transmembrane protein, putative [Tetrahymena thermophila SB210]EAR91973.2 transmembrane protein, putative [Tetrahymena thermophila SB210]|eukprot:XP_001012218.2 transmembrane protein, putative [Tetrahymena thermophila SB210]